MPRILYLDSDVIVNAPLSALYAADLTHHMLAACQTASGIADGVLLFNLDSDASWEPFFLQKKLSAVLPLDPKVYNLPARTAYTAHNLHYETVRTQAAIVHFCGSKPWEGNCFHCDIEQLWWDYAKDVPFYEDLMEHTLHEIVTDPTVINYISNLRLEHKQLLDIIEKYEIILERTSCRDKHSPLLGDK